MANSQILVTGADGRIRLLAAQTGQVGWESAPLQSFSPVAVWNAGAIDAVFVGTLAGDVHRLDHATGVSQAFSDGDGEIVGLAHADDVVYVNAGSTLVAHKPGTGVLWKVQMNDLAWGNPAVANGVVYAGSWDNVLRAIKADGTAAWTSTTFDYWATQPAVVNDVVYATAWEKLIALNAKTGQVLWTSAAPDKGTLLTPVAFENHRLFATTAWGGVFCFDAKTGALIWRTHFGGIPTPATCWNGRVFASAEHGAGDGYLKAFRAADGSLEWTSSQPVSHTGDAVSRAIVDPALYTNYVFVTSQSGYAYAFDQSTGAFGWKAAIGGEDWPLDPVWSDGAFGIPWKHGKVLVDPKALRLKHDLYVKINLPRPQPLRQLEARLRQVGGSFSADERKTALGNLEGFAAVGARIKTALTDER